MTRNASDGPYRCPVSCDPDCEINGWGCHEAHGERKHREHDPEACEARAAAGNLRWLLDAGWQVELGRASSWLGVLEPYHLQFRRNGTVTWRAVLGVSPGDALARAVDLARGEADPAAKGEPDAPVCRGFWWIGQSFATCDQCGKPAWEHEGEMRLREGAVLFGGSGDDWELRPWKPGEAEAIKRKWAPR